MKTVLLILTTLLISCEDISITKLDSITENTKIELNTLPLVTDLNASAYTLSGTCTSDIDRVHLSVNGNDNSTDCTDNQWSMTLDMTSEPNGSVNLGVSYERNSVVSNEVESVSTTKAVDTAPTTSNTTATNFNEDTSTTVNLPYNDEENNAAISCDVSGASNLGLSVCTCSLGLCYVNLTPSANYHGASSFTYNVTANNKTSNTSTIDITVNSVNDAPIISSSCSSTTKVGSNYSCTNPSATTDSFGETITWSLGSNNTCSFATINSTTGDISGVPAKGDEGDCTLEIVASDGSLDTKKEEDIFVQYNIVEASTIAGYVSDGKIIGNKLYLTKITSSSFSSSSGTLDVMDISDPTSPTLISSAIVDQNSRPYSLEIDGNYAYINASRAFFIYDISDSTNMTKIYSSTSSYAGNYAGIIKNGNNLIVQSNSQTRVYDVTDPTSPILQTSTTTLGFNYFINNGKLYSGAGNSGAKVYDLSDLLTGTLTTRNVSPGGFSKASGGDGTFLYVTGGRFSGGGTLKSYSLAEEPMQTVVSSLTTTNNMDSIQVLGDELFITGAGSGAGINIIDKSNGLRVKGQSPNTRCYGTSTYMGLGDISGDTMILTCGSNGAKIYTK